MAFADSLFGGPSDQPQAQNVPAQPDLADQWRGWLADEKNKTALMQFGISLMQPMGIGQSPLGQVGQALGHAGEALDRKQASDLAVQEQTSKNKYREQTGEAATAKGEAALTGAEARANVAGARAGEQASRLELAREKLSQQGNLTALQRQIQAQGAYQRYLKAENDARLLEPGRAPPLEAKEFYQKYGFGDLLGGASGVPSGDVAGGGSSNTPPAAYPDARKAPDGNWYVQKNGKYFKVQE